MRAGARAALATLLLAAAGGCTSQPRLDASDAGFVQWIGLDSRPLAVGSEIPVTLEIATDAGAAPTYSVTSSDPSVVDVEDAGDERLLLAVLGEGSATLELQTLGQRADLSVTAELPAAVTIWDAEHFAAGVGGPLDSGSPFAVLETSEEVLQGVVLDASARELNSWGLVRGNVGSLASGLLVFEREPEQFILASAGISSGSSGTFTAGLVDEGESSEDGGGFQDGDGGLLDAGSSVSYTIDFIQAATSARILRGGPSNLNVVAQAFTDAGTEVFGIDDWEFSCYPGDSCTMNRLSPSAVSLSIGPGSGSHDVTAFSSSQAVTGYVVIP